VDVASARLDRLETHIEAALPTWPLAPVVQALQALSGVAMVAAATLVAELGDITRFTKPTQLMAYLGLVPSENSSSGKRLPRRYHQDRQRGGAAHADRGRLELPVPGPDRPRTADPSGKAHQDVFSSRNSMTPQIFPKHHRLA